MKKTGDKINVTDTIEGKDVNLDGVITKICYDYIEVDWHNDCSCVVKYETEYGNSIDDSDIAYPTSISLSGLDIPENPFDYLKNKMINEGFHYCFNGYSDWSEIEDKKFQKLRKKYLKQAKKLEDYINSKAN